MDTARQIAARVRAARAYADLDQQTVAERLQVSIATLRRIERGDRVATRGELRELAVLTQVPDSFLTDGWAAGDDEAAADQVRALQASMDESAKAHARDMEVMRGRLEGIESLLARVKSVTIYDRDRPETEGEDATQQEDPAAGALLRFAEGVRALDEPEQPERRQAPPEAAS
ncbi:MAG: helix-turn-helix domain-containing protein [Actinobacteria bacterium]|nr:helix-turn-helix domain-containing protein [Actinomycetota bacterium]